MYKIEASCQIPGLAFIYEQVFGKDHKGTFIEVGAYDGETWSNTAGLADTGWKGVYIEPIPEYADKCISRHSKNDVKVLTVAVGNKNIDRISIYKNGDITTMDENIAELMRQMREDWKNPMKPSQVKQETLNDILDNLQIATLDLLVVDTEGYELQVLENFNFKKYVPKMLIIELHKCSPMWQRHEIIKTDTEKIEALVLGAGYRLIYEDDINSIFILGN